MSTNKTPEIISIFELIERNHPEIYSLCPNLDLKNLSQTQLEKLARGDSVEEVLEVKPAEDRNYHTIDKQAQKIFEKEKTGKGHGCSGTYPRDSVSSSGLRIMKKKIRGS